MENLLEMFGAVHNKLEHRDRFCERSFTETLHHLDELLRPIGALLEITVEEALMLAAVVLETVNPRNYSADHCKMTDLADRINVNNFEILRYRQSLQSLANRDFLQIGTPDFEADMQRCDSELVTAKQRRAACDRSVLPPFNERITLTELFIGKLLT